VVSASGENPLKRFAGGVAGDTSKLTNRRLVGPTGTRLASWHSKVIPKVVACLAGPARAHERQIWRLAIDLTKLFVDLYFTNWTSFTHRNKIFVYYDGRGVATKTNCVCCDAASVYYYLRVDVTLRAGNPLSICIFIEVTRHHERSAVAIQPKKTVVALKVTYSWPHVISIGWNAAFTNSVLIVRASRFYSLS